MPSSLNTAITVVSGLPRSGTSMLMQMLAAGGIEALTDGRRAADQDNPKGYLEYEAVKRLAQDNSWVPLARGKAIKVVTHLIPNLPAGEQYKVIFVQRDLEEVLDSQETMLARLGTQGAPRQVLRNAFTNHLAAFESMAALRPEVDVLAIQYSEVIGDPLASAQRIARFLADSLAEPLDPHAMAGVVDSALYRNRREREP